MGNASRLKAWVLTTGLMLASTAFAAEPEEKWPIGFQVGMGAGLGTVAGTEYHNMLAWSGRVRWGRLHLVGGALSMPGLAVPDSSVVGWRELGAGWAMSGPLEHLVVGAAYGAMDQAGYLTTTAVDALVIRVGWDLFGWRRLFAVPIELAIAVPLEKARVKYRGLSDRTEGEPYDLSTTLTLSVSLIGGYVRGLPSRPGTQQPGPSLQESWPE
jgi:hypothetical protein